MKNLENYGVHEMNAMEIRKTDGGSIFTIILSIILTKAIENEIKDFAEGFNDYYKL